MTPAQAKNALAFLVRVNLTGAEVPAYTEVAQALQVLANPPVAAQIPATQPSA